MKILLLGNGGREHAIAAALQRSALEPQIYTFANAKNPGVFSLSAEYHICTAKNFGEADEFKELVQFAKKHQVDFAVLGPDDPIGAGVADVLLKHHIPSVGPLKALARIESSKSFARELLEKYEISGNPEFRVFEDTEGLEEFCEQLEGDFVVKNDGLCGGKGVFVSGDHFFTIGEGVKIASEILEKKKTVVIEQKLIGQEFSLMFFCDGNTLRVMPAIQDHKRAHEGDKGPNTGGMGTYSAPENLPFLDPEYLEQAEEMSRAVVKALEEECNEKYKGILYGGFIATKNGTRLVEFNARFGDPEALNVLSILESDFGEICLGIINGNLEDKEVEFAKKATVCKYVVPEGYPEDPVKGEKIEIGDIPEGVETYYASVEEKEGALFLKGSRAIGFVGIAESIEKAEELAEEACQQVSGPVFHRSDIGKAELIEQRVQMMQNL